MKIFNYWIISHNDLEPDRQQAITRTNADWEPWHYLVSLGHNDLLTVLTRNQSSKV